MMNSEEYKSVVRSCVLDKDMENFLHDDLMKIWQRGLNMTGGQKYMIHLAMIVYIDANINRISLQPFSDCVMVSLEARVIFVTHQVLEKRAIIQEGTSEDFRDKVRA
ncbi:ABC transporter C family member 8-like [Lolium rigidum]|uniref:ABC transporter C family member 8-like n=1 Tax=Lolium rigidum TaxID=89674 RepID=UPI001F5E23EF|nr:ABC transporter C family member 8-like [Lolium rigidum]